MIAGKRQLARSGRNGVRIGCAEPLGERRIRNWANANPLVVASLIVMNESMVSGMMNQVMAQRGVPFPHEQQCTNQLLQGGPAERRTQKEGAG